MSEELQMSVDTSTLANYEGKQVILTMVREGETDAVELEGKVEAASEMGVAFKEKGKRDVDLVMPNQIEEIALAPTKPRNLTQKKLKPITDSNARQHLLDRHGYDRSVVNAMTDEQALAEHEDIEHDDLGHKHESEDDAADEAAGESESTEPDES